MAKTSTPLSPAERVARHRQRQRSKPPLQRKVEALRKDGLEVPDLYDQTSQKLADQMAKDIQRLTSRAEELNTRLEARARQIPDPEARALLLGEVARATRIQVKTY